MAAPPRSALLLAVALAFGPLLVGCRPPEGASRTSGDGQAEVTVAVEVEPRLGASPVTVDLRGVSGPVTGAEVEVTGDMTHAGMIPVLRDTIEIEPGLYQADDFEFTMAGDWIVTAEVVLPGGDRASGELRTTVPGR